MEELLSAYADRETTPAESAQVEAHVADCRACGLRLAVLAKSKQALASMAAPAAPRDLKETLRRAAARAEAASPESSGPSFGQRLSAWRSALSPRYGFAFGLAAFLLVGLWFERRPEEAVPLDVMLSAHRQYTLERPLGGSATRPGASGPVSEDAGNDLEDDETDE
ncbi:MAG: zf-HC2 domain-containing protein [Elusimicrobia bacterium]|nr:zf-HC2 domain-containing protein [Elusimicrobiota bacterium]